VFSEFRSQTDNRWSLVRNRSHKSLVYTIGLEGAKVNHKQYYFMVTVRASAGGKGYFPLGNWNFGPKFSRKHEVSSSIPITSLNFCNDSLFPAITLILHKSQVHCLGVMQQWVCSSLMSATLHGQTWSCIICCWSLLRSIIWQQIFRGLLQVTIVGVWPPITVEPVLPLVLF